MGYELIRKVPNLREVAEIIARQQDLDADTGFRGSETILDLIYVGSRMLKLVLDYEQLISSGKTTAGAVAILKSNETITALNC